MRVDDGGHRIRPVTDRDWKAVTAIFNHFVTDSFAAYPDEPVDESFFQEHHEAHPEYPFVVAEMEDRVVGFTECGRFRGVGLKKGQPFDMVWQQREQT